jgi:hypothetical protein
MKRKNAAVEPIRGDAGPVDRRAEVKKSAEMIYGSLTDVIRELILQAKGGNCTAAKFLVEFAGVKVEMEEPEAPRENAAELLVKMLTARREECMREGASAE